MRIGSVMHACYSNMMFGQHNVIILLVCAKDFFFFFLKMCSCSAVHVLLVSVLRPAVHVQMV